MKKLEKEFELEVIDIIETKHKDVQKGTSWRIVSINSESGEKVSHKVEVHPSEVQVGWKARIVYSSDQTSVNDVVEA